MSYKDLDISAYAHITDKTEILAEHQEGENYIGQCVTVRFVDGLHLFIHSKERALELADKLQQAAKEWKHD